MKKIFQCGTVGLIFMMGLAVSFGQTTSGSEAGRPAASSPTVTGGGNAMSTDAVNSAYRIGPGDVLDVRVFNRPQLSREVRVDNEGNIQMPMIDQNIKAACLSETELAKVVADLYLKYQRNPYVSVFIKEFSSQPVAVIGAVEKPGQIILRRRMRLFDALTVAGGPSKLAGSTVEIAHTGGSSLCESGQGQPDLDDIKGGFVALTLNDTLRGDEKSNPWLRPGDYVRVPEAQQAFVVGNVYKPQSISLRESVTVSQAIAMAGGPLRATQTNKVRIIRPVPGSSAKKEIYVDLVAIDKRRAEDILLLPNDIVDVPVDGGKMMRDKIFGALTGGLSSLPIIFF